MPSHGCPVPPQGRGWGGARSPCVNGFAGGIIPTEGQATAPKRWTHPVKPQFPLRDDPEADPFPLREAAAAAAVIRDDDLANALELVFTQIMRPPGIDAVSRGFFKGAKERCRCSNSPREWPLGFDVPSVATRNHW